MPPACCPLLPCLSWKAYPACALFLPVTPLQPAPSLPISRPFPACTCCLLLPCPCSCLAPSSLPAPSFARLLPADCLRVLPCALSCPPIAQKYTFIAFGVNAYFPARLFPCCFILMLTVLLSSGFFYSAGI